jgi:hypothetical protein
MLLNRCLHEQNGDVVCHMALTRMEKCESKVREVQRGKAEALDPRSAYHKALDELLLISEIVAVAPPRC